MNYKEKVVKRQECNRQILKELEAVVESCQDLRFIQILADLGLPYCDRALGKIPEEDYALDRYAEESVDTLEKVKKESCEFWRIKTM